MMGVLIIAISSIAVVGLGVTYTRKKDKMEMRVRNAIIASLVLLTATAGIGVKIYADEMYVARKEKAYDEYVVSNQEKFNVNIEYGESHTLWYDKDLLKPKDKDKLEVKGDKLGTKEHLVSFLDNDNYEYNITYVVNVVDTTPPKITSAAEVEVYVGDDVSAKSLGFKAIDEVDGDVGVSIKEDVNTSIPGEHKMTVEAVDKSGNKASKKFMLIVKDKEVVVNESLPDNTKDVIVKNDKESGSKHNSSNSQRQDKPSSKPSSPAQKPSPTPRPESKPEPKPDNTIYHQEGMAKELFNLTNAERRKEGLPDLKWNPKLAEYARIRAEEVTVNLSHTRPDGSQWHTLDPNLIYGENIAYYQRTVPAAMEELMISPPHARNILSKNFVGVGTAVVKQGDKYYYIQLFTEVE